MKKILSILLALTFILTLLVACGSAEHDPMSGEKPSKYSKGLDYEINGKYCTITGIGSCKDTEIYIPEEIEGKKVTTIGAKAFEDNTTVTKIWLPDTITKIERRAFMNCSNLKVINIPKSAGTIEAQIFDGCDQLEEFYYYYIPSSKYEKNEFVIPKAKKIVFGGKTVYEFKNKDTVQEIILLDSVTGIPGWAFSGCKSLTNIIIPDSVTSINERAFRNCTSLTSITIPDSVTYIGSGAFEGCTSLTSITIPGSVENSGNSTSSYDYSMFYESSIIEVVLSEGIERIEGIRIQEVIFAPTILYGPFYNMHTLQKISIPTTVKYIGMQAFHGTNLETIEYAGTMAEWNQIEKGEGWNDGIPATVVHCTDGDVPIQ